MKIVHIEDFFHPDAGYQINILPKYMVKQDHEVIIVTSEIEKVPSNLTSFFGKEGIEKADRKYEQETGVKIIRLPVKRFISSRAFFEPIIFKVVNDLSPDILYVHGNDTLIGIQYTLRSGKLDYPLVLDSHMLEMASVNRLNKLFRIFYKKLITPKIIKNNIPVIRTQNDEYIQRHLGVPLKQSPWISVGSDTLLFSPNKIAKKKFRNDNNIGEEDFVVVYTGKLDENKGGLLLAEAFKNKFSCSKKVVLLVVGNANGDYGNKVEEIFNGSENLVLRFPTQKYTDLAKFYQAADLSVFPKQCSLSFYDAQACGLPVIAEDNSINVDRLSHQNGYTFEANNVQSFRGKIVECVSMEDEKYFELKKNSRYFVSESFNYKDITKEYLEVLESKYNDYKMI